jgi:hypothetical protein
MLLSISIMKMLPMDPLKLNTDQPQKVLRLPVQHILMRLISAVITILLGSRGSFKTSRAIPLYVVEKVHEMPRSSGVIVGLSFEHLGDNTIPPFLQALEEMGFHSGEHYVFGKRPPDDWPRPYLGIYNDKYDHVMTWYNGTAMHIVSLKKTASANGISAQWGIFDEAKYMKPGQLREEIFPIFRGNEDYFAKKAGYLSKLFCTDKEIDPAQLAWLLEYRKLVDQELVDIVTSMALELNDLRTEFYTAGVTKTRQKALATAIGRLEEELSELRSKLVYVAEINAEDVRPLLGDAWFNDKKRSSSERVWKVSFMNEDPQGAADKFYPGFDDQVHTYADGSWDDYLPTRPLIITPDYQHSVAPITVAQLHKEKLAYIDEVYTLAQAPTSGVLPNGNASKGELDEALELFCTRYAAHKNRTVYYVYNSQAKGKQVNALKYDERVVRKLRKHRFNVVKVFIGRQEDHYTKHTDTIDWMRQLDKSLPAIVINRDKCSSLITSIKNAPAKTMNGETKKDKSMEDTGKFPDVDQSKTTHFSDCFDDCNRSVFKLKKIRYAGSGGGMGFASR